MSKWFQHPSYQNEDSPPNAAYQKYLDDLGLTHSEIRRKVYNDMYDVGLIKVYPPFPRDMRDGVYYLLNPACMPIRDKFQYEGKATFYGFGNIDTWIPFFPWAHDYLLKGQDKAFRCGNRAYCIAWKHGEAGAKPCSVSPHGFKYV